MSVADEGQSGGGVAILLDLKAANTKTHHLKMETAQRGVRTEVSRPPELSRTVEVINDADDAEASTVRQGISHEVQACPSVGRSRLTVTLALVCPWVLAVPIAPHS